MPIPKAGAAVFHNRPISFEPLLLDFGGGPNGLPYVVLAGIWELEHQNRVTDKLLDDPVPFPDCQNSGQP